MITLENNSLVFRFPEVHAHAECSIAFQRTLRIPNDDRAYPLPPGLGNFPLRHLDDYVPNLPAAWTSRGGVIMPMRQAEAMWVNFIRSRNGYLFAVKVAAGKINAVTGEAWTNGLNYDSQDYLVVPEQPWLDGYCVEKGTIRQFVAAPLGEGHTAEEQLTGASVHGGIQLIVYPMKAEWYEKLRQTPVLCQMELSDMLIGGCASSSMGLAAGGRMKQEIYDDEHGLDAWDQRYSSRCFITIANAAAWQAITGEHPPGEPPTAADYTKAGLPWFDYYDGEREALAGAKLLADLKSYLAETRQAGDAGSGGPSAPVDRIIQLKGQRPREVREATL